MTKTAGISRVNRAFRKAGFLRLRPVPLTVALLACGLAMPASALDFAWLGGTGNWADGSKWSLLGVPGSGDSASINGNNHVITLSDTRSLATLIMSNGYLGGSGVLNTGSASFGSAVLGLAGTTGGVLNVAGSAQFNSSSNQNLRYGQIVNLNGNTTWSAGNGRIEVDQGYAGDSSTNPHGASQLNIAAGTTFTDAGAAAASGTKQIGYRGGQINNAGTYVRNGQGTTQASYGFNNTGTLQVNAGTFSLDGNSSLRGLSSGTVNVAAGATFNLGDADITAGSINNAGRVTMSSSSVATIAAAASINGAWELNHSSAQLQHSGTHSISSLSVASGYLGGTGVLNTGSASFGSAVLGWSRAEAGGVLNVNGNASFNGNSNQDLRYGQIVNLNGNTTWSAGNGRIEVDQGYAGDSSTNPHGASQLNIATGTTFTDAGAAAASGTKQIGYSGGQINNAGTYVRNGQGTTQASYGFNNTGTLQVNAGVFAVDSDFNNTGIVTLAAGAALHGTDYEFVNAGILSGFGSVITRGATFALDNAGTIDPGSAAALGALTISGDLLMADASVLRIDLGGSGLSDTLAITSDVTVNGELAIWGAAGAVLLPDEVYTIATFAQRTGDTRFDQISWHGLNSANFAVNYTANSVELRVIAVPVPEPATTLLLLAGLGGLAGLVQRRRAAAARPHG